MSSVWNKILNYGGVLFANGGTNLNFYQEYLTQSVTLGNNGGSIGSQSCTVSFVRVGQMVTGYLRLNATVTKAAGEYVTLSFAGGSGLPANFAPALLGNSGSNTHLIGVMDSPNNTTQFVIRLATTSFQITAVSQGTTVVNGGTAIAWSGTYDLLFPFAYVAA